MAKRFQSKIFKGLIEYNTENNLGYSNEQLEQLSWSGMTESKALKNYISRLAKKNMTTTEEEYKKWYNSVSQIKFKETIEEKKEEPEINTDSDSTQN
jgi:hypothetical protein